MSLHPFMFNTTTLYDEIDDDKFFVHMNVLQSKLRFHDKRKLTFNPSINTENC